jgi:hypothetical protein
LVEAHRRSEQTVKDFCAERDMSEASFDAGRRHLDRQVADPVESLARNKKHGRNRTSDAAAVRAASSAG